MNIRDGLKLEPTFNIPYYGIRGVEIPDVGRDDFPKFLFEMGLRTGVEIGVDQGEFGIKLCEAGLKVYGIDPYMRYSEYKSKDEYENHYEQAVANLKGHDYIIINKFSMDALDDFEDESLDFVFIDGNHSLPYVSADIAGWDRKIKKGGIMSGHDYGMNRRVHDGIHVKFAVDTYAYLMRIPKLYILGRKDAPRGEKRDRWRSWFWIK